MPRICETCKHYVEADVPQPCPDGHGSMKFTLLAPAGEELERIEPDTRSRYHDPEPASWLTHPYAKPAGAALLVVAGVLVIVWQFGGNSFDSRVAKLKPGMTMTEAARVMGSPTEWPGSRRRFPDVDMSTPTEGDGEVVWEHGLQAVRVTFRNGIVTNVEEIEAKGGMRRRSTVVR